MNCNCYDDTKASVEEHMKAKLPEGAQGFELDLEGYVFGISDSGVTHRAAFPLNIRYMASKKAGGMKKVTQKTFMRASYCPFCGLSYESGKPAEPAAAQSAEPAPE